VGYEFIQVERQGAVTTVTLNRPEVMNALHIPMHQELQAAFDDFADDDRQQVCIVTGAGERAFCAGSDLKAVAAGARGGYPRSGYGGLVERCDLDKPLIAAVNGVCLGGGFELALACDLIIAAETASFGLPEPRVGGIALGGGVHRLVRQIGQKKAMGLLLTGRRISSAEASDLGLVNEVAPDGGALAAAQRWAALILECAPLSIRATKEAALRGLDEPSLADAMKRQASYPAYVRWAKSEDRLEGSRAFAEKRPPSWKFR